MPLATCTVVDFFLIESTSENYTTVLYYKIVLLLDEYREIRKQTLRRTTNLNGQGIDFGGAA